MNRLNPLNFFGDVKDYVLSLIIDQYIGKYVKNIRGKLKTRLATGEIEVHGAELAQHALDQIKLPIGVRHGILGHLIIKNLFAGFVSSKDSGLHIVLSDLVLIVQPLSSFEVTEEHDKAEDEKMWEDKEAKLERQVKRWIDQLHRRYTGSAVEKTATYSEQYVNDLFRTMKIDIYRVHVMLEDEFSNDKRPYTMGVVIDSVKLRPKETQYIDRSANSGANVKNVDDHSMTDIRTNTISIQNLRVYLNSGRIGDLPVRPDLLEWQQAQHAWSATRLERLERHDDVVRSNSLRTSNKRGSMEGEDGDGGDGNGGGGGGGGGRRGRGRCGRGGGGGGGGV